MLGSNIYNKFIQILVNKHRFSLLLLISYSSILFKDEVNLNIYNLSNPQSFFEFLNLSDIFKANGIILVNVNKNNLFANNLSFLNPLTIELFNENPYNGVIFDLHFNPSLDYNVIKHILINLKKAILR